MSPRHPFADSVPDSEASPAPERGNVLVPRLMGLDVGSKTIGVAVSDPLGITAQGLDTIRRRNKRTDLQELGAIVERFAIAEIVVGYPLRLSGQPSAQSERVELFAADVEKRFGLPVRLWDERLTSVQANRLLRESEISIRKRGQAVDRLAAVLILQSYLDARSSRP